MNDELDHIMGALRSPATSDELAGESVIVDRMYHAHESKGPTMFTSRRTRVATRVAAGVLGFGSVAAAGPAAMQMLTDQDQDQEQQEQPPAPEDGEVVVEQPEDDEEDGEEVVEDGEEDGEEAKEAAEEVEIVAEEAEDDTEKALELVDDPATDFFDESQCLPGNHGKTVSAVARGEFEYYELDENMEKIEVEVRDAARSSCGKDFEVDPEENVELEESEIEKIEESESKGKPDHAGGKDKGKPDHAGGKGKGKGGRG